MTGQTESRDVGCGGNTELIEQGRRGCIRPEHCFHQRAEPLRLALCLHVRGEEHANSQRFRKDEDVPFPQLSLGANRVRRLLGENRKADGDI